MTADLKPYPKTKNSNVTWLGDVPEHWTLKRAKWLFRKANRPVRDADEVVTCFRDGSVTLRKNRRLTGFTESIKEIGYQGVRCGDLVIHAMDAFAGAIGVSDSDGKCSPVYSVCEPKTEVQPLYFAYIVREMARKQWIQALSKGIRERSTNFRFSEFAAQVLPHPPIHEQKAIVHLIRYTDRRVQRYIETKRRLIKLLEEQKKVIINQAVTRGLDPHVPLKDSGVERLGLVPEHWEIKRLSQLANTIGSGKTPKGGAEIYSKEGVLFVRSQNVYDEGLKLDDVVRIPHEVDATMSGTRLRFGDILLNITGASLGRTCIFDLDEAANVNQHVCRIRLTQPQFVPFSSWFLKSMFAKTQYDLGQTGAAREGLSRTQVATTVVLVPPVEEQQAIVAFLERETASLNNAINRFKREIELLAEYRTRLIADVVTGKLDVREAAANLPEEPLETDISTDSLADLDEEEAVEETDEEAVE